MVDIGVYAAYQPEPTGRDEHDRPATVREAVVADVPACLDLVERVLLLDRGPWETSLTDSVTDPERMLFVAELSDGRIAGYARATRWTPPDDAPPNAAPAGWYLLGLVVAPEHRRRGIGRALTVARLEAVAGRATEIWYFANAHNQSSLDLHTELGFTEVTRDFWFPGLTFDGGVGVLARLEVTGAARPESAGR
ncbi:GNAT family N-acetyltransferase [Actinoplanes bogorensis]|uniref:GNAT family N-acetyltransferase n=1 Tax=Paractinoplanes bogorensis TaxID=1610840 RepID=A0ABS5YN20_9ACTN|nr:GNAT family N-acetyltransferase [Actinoplanes bogorensis]MBU2664805.1 GNAT family N-acetyltransferase [Actinoplanes bogorensis]